ncbi:MAG: alcohol dehydrogenase catalytic domain-containing protein [Phycisphaerales bacterium]|jgi:L-iditol 2-dehydrogenase|nr:alcohol dehydrogenase catalytic domain-containing protein [Phycisphaerales bacterium]
MKAAFLTGIRGMEIRQTPDPQITAPDEVLVKIDAVGVCGSDVHYYTTGAIGSQKIAYPWTVGHECAGTILETGSSVISLQPGQRVAVDPLKTCGTCDQCLAGREHTCRNQAFLACPGQLAGALAEYIVMPASCCLPVPDSMNNDEVTIVEPLSIGMYACGLAPEKPPKRAAILGSGPIGLSVLLSLRAAGAEEIFVTDLLPERLKIAAAMGATWTGCHPTQDVVSEILDQTKLGVDCVFECAGQQETLDQCVQLLRPGGTILAIGIPELDRVSFCPDVMRRKEIRLQNVRRQNGCVQAAIDLISSKRADVMPMVTHHFGLDESRDAFEMVADYRDGVVKAIINI